MAAHPELVAAARALVDPLLRAQRPRLLVGIAGEPGAGKSTLAGALVRGLRRDHGADAATSMSMDGFHLDNRELARRGLADRKGAPETFDAYGFVHLLRRLREPGRDETVYVPTFDRARDLAIASAVGVPAGTRVVVVEGNYLLLSSQPWVQVRDLLDLALFLDVKPESRIDGLLRRHRRRGLDAAAAHDWVFRNDEANAAVVAATRSAADHILTRPT